MKGKRDFALTGKRIINEKSAVNGFSSMNAKAASKSKQRSLRMIGLLTIILIAVFLLSFCLGRYGVPVEQVVKILFSKILHFHKTWTAEMETVVLNIRLPRILIACLVGCCLSAAGAAYQGVFKNPMASPDILGASSGAAFGAALSILLGASSQTITCISFLFSITTVCAAFFIARKAPGEPVVNLILAGITAGSLCSAGTSYIKLVADPSNQLPAITYWLMGSMSGARIADVKFIFPPMALGLIPLLLLSWRMNLLTLGDEEARAMGVNVNFLRFAVIVSATLITAASVSVSGMIGWVGLVIPHLCRKLAGSNYRYLMPASMLAGACFLLLVDNVSRNLLAVEIPIGILTAVIGAPFFIYLLTRKEKFL